MQIDHNSLLRPVHIGRTGGAPASGGWQVGTLLQGIVRHESGRLQLEIGGERYAVTSQLRLPDGSRLQLRVAQLQPPVLQIVTPRSAAETIATALRQLLPQQPSLTPLIQLFMRRSEQQHSAPNTAGRTAGQPSAGTGLALPAGLLQGTGLSPGPAAGLRSMAQAPHFPSSATASQGAAQHGPAQAVTLRLALAGAQALPLPPLRHGPLALSGSHSNALPPDLLNRLWAALPQATDVQNAGLLKQTLLRSGLFFEALLGRLPLGAATQLMQRDFKAKLLRALNDATRDKRESAGPADAGSPIRRALARLQMLQLHAATSEKLDLIFELPLRFGQQVELLQLRIQRDPARSNEPEKLKPPLRVQLAFHFHDLGNIHAQLLLNGMRLSTNWWAERPDTAAALTAALPELSQKLTEAGFEVSGLSCREGRPAVAIDAMSLPSEGLLNEKV